MKKNKRRHRDERMERIFFTTRLLREVERKVMQERAKTEREGDREQLIRIGEMREVIKKREKQKDRNTVLVS